MEVSICNFYRAWDKEMDNLHFWQFFLYENEPYVLISSHCYHGNKTAATFKKGIFANPPECLTTSKIWRGG